MTVPQRAKGQNTRSRAIVAGGPLLCALTGRTRTTSRGHASGMPLPEAFAGRQRPWQHVSRCAPAAGPYGKDARAMRGDTAQAHDDWADSGRRSRDERFTTLREIMRRTGQIAEEV